MNFTKYHHQDSPLLICNVWDVQSAKAAEKLNFKSIGTSSSAIASMLGYQDGEEISFDELLYIVKRISKTVELPLSVDLEAGYSRIPKVVTEHIMHLTELGVVGINLEDSIVNETREIVGVEEFSSFLKTVVNIIRKNNNNVFLNVRTDTYLLGLPNAVEETIARAKIYEQAGADGLFVPCIEKQKDIISVVQGTNLPINVMCMPGLPDFDTLQEIGVKRISMGNFLYNKLGEHLELELNKIIAAQSFETLFAK